MAEVTTRFKSDNERNPWPFKVDYARGFSDEQLTGLTSSPKRSHFDRLKIMYFRQSEVYGIGRSLRTWTSWPSFLPIPVSSDHGVNFSDQLATHDANSPANFFITWSSWRAPMYSRKKTGVIRIMHPWIAYRKIQGLTPSNDAEGTMLFVQHALPWTRERKFDWISYIESFSGLSKPFRPSAILLHPNEVHLGLHKSLRVTGLPIFTLGHTDDSLFVDRFYDLLGRFRYATSPDLGSHSFYCEEFGVQFFIHGSHPGHEGLRPTEIPPRGSFEYVVDHARQVFAKLPSGRSMEREILVDMALGRNRSIYLDRKILRQLFLRESFRVLPRLAWKAFSKLYPKFAARWNPEIPPKQGKEGRR